MSNNEYISREKAVKILKQLSCKVSLDEASAIDVAIEALEGIEEVSKQLSDLEDEFLMV